MRRLFPLLVLAAAAVARPDSPDYLKLRDKNAVHEPIGVVALRATTSPRIVELSGKVSGTCRSGDSTLLILQSVDGESQEIDAKAFPDWLPTTEAPVRILVRATRVQGKGVRAEFLAAAPESDVLVSEEAYWRRVATYQRTVQARREARTTASRHATTPRSPISGPIGHGASRAPVVPQWQVTPIYAAFIRHQNPRLTVDQATSIANDVIRFSNGYGVDARLVMSILLVESGFDPAAVSRTGAVGLGQLMPGTARWMGVQNSYDTTQNLYGMVKLLYTLSRQFRAAPEDPVVLAAYNAGDGAVRRHGGVPPYRETQAYVRRVTAIFNVLRG